MRREALLPGGDIEVGQNENPVTDEISIERKANKQNKSCRDGIFPDVSGLGHGHS